MKTFTWVLLLSALLLGCDRGPTPEQVADEYWQATREQDLERARAAAVPGSMEGYSASSGSREEGESMETRFGEASIQEDKATVPTDMVITTPEGQTLSFSFDTKLARVDGAWKVEANETMGQMMKSMLGVTMEQLVGAMGNAMGEAMQGVGEAMGEAMQGMGQAMGEAMQGAAQGGAAAAYLQAPEITEQPLQGKLFGLDWEAHHMGVAEYGSDMVQGTIYGEACPDETCDVASPQLILDLNQFPVGEAGALGGMRSVTLFSEEKGTKIVGIGSWSSERLEDGTIKLGFRLQYDEDNHVDGYLMH